MSICLHYGKVPKFFMFYICITISGDSGSYFLEMIMLISLKGILTQTRMGIGRVTLHRKGPIFFFDFFFFCGFFFYSQNYYFWRPSSYFIEISMLINLKWTLAHKRKGFGWVTLASKGPIRGRCVFL